MEHDIKLTTFGENQFLGGLQNFYDIPDNSVVQENVKCRHSSDKAGGKQ